MNSYKAKLDILNNSILNASDFVPKVTDPVEKCQTDFCKFALNLYKFASNHGVRAELGVYPIHIKINNYIIKYWHRLENLVCPEDNLLKQAYMLCKNNNHEWYQNIQNYLTKYGLNFIIHNIRNMEISYIIKIITDLQSNIYIQQWDQISNMQDKLLFLNKCKKYNYCRSNYLNINNVKVETRTKITKLRLGCSKLRAHCYLSKDESNICCHCKNEPEDARHFLINCKRPNLVEVRRTIFNEINNIKSGFLTMTDCDKVFAILNLCTNMNAGKDTDNIINLYTQFIDKMFRYRFSSS